MMFLQIMPNVFSQFRTCAMEDYAHYERRSFHERCDFLVVKTFVIAQNKHLAGSLSESRHSLANQCVQLAIGMDCLGTSETTGNGVDFGVFESDGFRTGATAEQIEGSIYRGAREISFRISRPVVVVLTLNQPKKDCLEHIFCIGGTAGNALRGPKDSAVVCLEECFQFAWGLVCH